VAQVLRALALLVGTVLTVTGPGGGDLLDLLGAASLLAWLTWRAVPTAGSRVRLRETIGAELLLAVVVVVATGGWASPWLLAMLVPVGLATLGLDLGRTVALVCLVLGAVTLASIPGGLEVPVAVQGASTLLVTVGFAAVTRITLLANSPEHHDALGAIDELWSVNALLEGLHQTASGSAARFSIEEAFAVVRSSSRPLAAADAVALLVVEDDGAVRPLAGHGLGTDAWRLPNRAGAPRRDGRPVVGPIDAGGLLVSARLGAYVWLPVSDEEPPHLLAVEFEPESGVGVDDLTPELLSLAQPLAVTIANATWFGRVRHLGVDEERQRIAARLHDSFAQSLAALAMELELSARRHPDDAGLRALVGQVRETLGGLRDTMVELRASVEEDRDLPTVLRALVDRLVQRRGMVADLALELDGSRPPRPVEQQLLRITQELVRRAAEDRGAIVVHVVYVVTDTEVRLEVHDDGVAAGGPRHDAEDLVRERAEAIGARLESSTDADGLATSAVVLALTPTVRAA
jgi:signal transduction histidine kinase